MADLVACLERCAFTQVRTVRSSGNVAFDCDTGTETDLDKQLESALAVHLGRSFAVIVRTADELATLLRSDPFAGHGLPADARRVVTFLRQFRTPRTALPLTEGTATVIHQVGREVFTAYRPGPEGPVFMKLIERAYGTDLTTRTWDTVVRCADA